MKRVVKRPIGGNAMWARRTRVLVLGAVLTLGLLATLLVQSPVPTTTVDEIMNDPSNFVGQEVAVRGEVRDGTINNGSMTFVLEGQTTSVLVNFVDASVANGLDDNRTVYAEGRLILSNDVYVLEADIIKTSCPSKYEADNKSE